MRGHRDLERVSIAAIVCALVAALVPWEIVRTIAAVPLCLFLPGYALVAAAFGSRELAPPKQLLLAVGVSLMVLVVATFFLNIFPFGLRTESWAVLLPLVVIAAARGAALSRNAPSNGRANGFSLPRPSVSSVVLTSLALLIGVGALVLAQKPLPAENAVGYAALWMLPSSADNEEDLVVGVISNEQDPASYWLEVEVGRREPRIYNFRLDPGEERTFDVTVPIASGDRVHVVASLYHKDRPEELYRRVSTWLPRQNTFP